MNAIDMTSVTGTRYRKTRVRGFADWNPKPGTVAVLAAVREVLETYRDYLPMTARQVFYRLVGSVDYPKTERAYARLLEYINRARRSGRLDWAAIRDDGFTARTYSGFRDPAQFVQSLRAAADAYQLDRQLYQPYFHEIWVEAAGMVPQVYAMFEYEGIPVYSSGGFNSTTSKYVSAMRFARRAQQTVVLHVGDYDPSGVAIVDSLAADINAFLADMLAQPAIFERAAVTPAQITEYELPGAPAKRNDRRGDFADLATQAEALTPTQLETVIRQSLTDRHDSIQLDDVVTRETRERNQLVADLDDLFDYWETR